MTQTLRIGFILALMNDGDAASWKEQFVENCIITSAANNAPLDMGTFLSFKHNLQEVFTPYDAPGDALEKMKNLRMKGDYLIDNHVAKFKMLVTSSGLGNTSAAVTYYYRESLPPALQKRIVFLEKPPMKLDDWYEWSTRLHHQWKRMQRILGRESKTLPKKTNNGGRKFYFPRRTERDPNAMDVDALTFGERNDLMKEG